MKRKLPILTALVWLLGTLAATDEMRLLAAESSVKTAPGQGTASSANPRTKGQQLLFSAAVAADQHASISTKLRLRINLFGHELIGSGSYHQVGSGSDKLLRLELKIPVGGKVSSHLQVCDGQFLWIRTDLLDNEVTLNRVDLRKVRRHLKANDRNPQFGLTSGWLALGGLPSLLASLEYFFQFDSPLESQLSNLSVWKIHGTWKPAELAKILPDQKEQLLAGQPPRSGSLPEQLPESVSIVLGQDDLFPYQITFMRSAEAQASATDVSRIVPFLTLELFEVRTEIDPLDIYNQGHHFSYKPKEKETDITEQFLQKISSRVGPRSR